MIVTKSNQMSYISLNRSIRESFIRAKYLDKAFVSKLPGPKSSNKVKGWSVRRKPKRSPSRDVAESQDNSEEDSDLTSGIMEGMTLTLQPVLECCCCILLWLPLSTNLFYKTKGI